ncbi:MAG: 2-hydroxyacyl-CoA dehydratase family protein [Candidatus Eremiobacteraeota bacterium]|nr:2-hydroxyacyl-CoA dehydratase family protein [Candidatus Eremiobacteraeota bacterium]
MSADDAAVIAATLKNVCEGSGLVAVRAWSYGHQGAPVVGYFPSCAPRELVYAAGGLSVGLKGGCRSLQDFMASARQDTLPPLSGIFFPSFCDEAGELSGMWDSITTGLWVRRLQIPLDLSPEAAIASLRDELLALAALMLGHKPDEPYYDKLREAIALTGTQRELLESLGKARSAAPWKIPLDEYCSMERSALLLHPAHHMKLAQEYFRGAMKREKQAYESAPFTIVSPSCAVTPVDLLRAIEEEGCTIVACDLFPGLLQKKPSHSREDDPLEFIAECLLHLCCTASQGKDGIAARCAYLTEQVMLYDARALLFITPASCKHAPGDDPHLQKALESEGIPSISIHFGEEDGDYRKVKEQAGAFINSLGRSLAEP